MIPSCRVKSLLLASAAALSAHADILPPDSHLVPRAITLVNTGEYPDQVFAALEFYPGQPDAPIAATRMGPGIVTKITGYKLDYIRIYAAKASDWAAIEGRLGLAKSAAPAASDWRTGLVPIAGEVAAVSEYAPNSSALASETFEYKLVGKGPDSVSLYASLQAFSDGSKKEVALNATGLRAPGPASRMARLAADGRSLVWVPQQSGIAAISLVGADGRRAWSTRRVAAGGKAQAIALPKLAAGRYLMSVQGRGWSQSAWLELGRR